MLQRLHMFNFQKIRLRKSVSLSKYHITTSMQTVNPECLAMPNQSK
jgi:hypothetical protein